MTQICFQALQTLPIKQQRRMVKRLQLLNEQCETKKVGEAQTHELVKVVAIIQASDISESNSERPLGKSFE